MDKKWVFGIVTRNVYDLLELIPDFERITCSLRYRLKSGRIFLATSSGKVSMTHSSCKLSKVPVSLVYVPRGNGREMILACRR